MSAALEAGRDLDRMVMAGVMGLTMSMVGTSEMVPHYSTDIADAWQVVEAMRERGWHPEIRWISDWDCKAKWWVNFGGHRLYDATADTAPLAICRAALRAVADATPKSAVAVSPATEVTNP